MTKRPELKSIHDGPMAMGCQWSRPAHHLIGGLGGQSCDAIYSQGQHAPQRYDEGQIERDYILRRNHPEEWYGVAWLPEFWLAVALGIAFVWSLVRDRIELTRNR